MGGLRAAQILVLPMNNRFTASRTDETGVLWCRSWDQKGNSYSCIEGDDHDEAGTTFRIPLG